MTDQAKYVIVSINNGSENVIDVNPTPTTDEQAIAVVEALKKRCVDTAAPGERIFEVRKVIHTETYQG
jgi:hypothetical protein